MSAFSRGLWGERLNSIRDSGGGWQYAFALLRGRAGTPALQTPAHFRRRYYAHGKDGHPAIRLPDGKLGADEAVVSRKNEIALELRTPNL
jgi:hypothetical protein